MAEFNHGIELRKLKDKYLPDLESNRGFNPSVFVDIFVLMLQNGGSFLEDMRELRYEEGLMKLIGRIFNVTMHTKNRLILSIPYDFFNGMEGGRVSSFLSEVWKSAMLGYKTEDFSELQRETGMENRFPYKAAIYQNYFNFTGPHL